eukprot:COSAG02_NODE_3927_length_6035_cov_7.810815_1_plen_88_part_00
MDGEEAAAAAAAARTARVGRLEAESTSESGASSLDGESGCRILLTFAVLAMGGMAGQPPPGGRAEERCAALWRAAGQRAAGQRAVHL